MSDKGLDTLIKASAAEFGLDKKVIKAICIVESGLDPWASRYESHWRWFLHPMKWAKLRRQTTKTERIQQATSWGLMQVMGTVARELGYDGALPALCVPRNGLKYGCMKLKRLLDKHMSLDMALAAYNAGTPTSRAGQRYATKVLVEMDKI